ncbi:MULTISPECIES: alanine/glycine:cation symporter family protein [unclassified Bacillus (in: firmicutes)]|uniref:alanine/glycine:cation symporter family protein n=1 Tax=unclassified Bacillus (in: firmicutes) TaxID=185979 RepID=UPI0022831A00|nr:alanine:cation symporter family protein [Bacillus sp. S20C3]MCY8202750.1 alanine:cation symporter family protein [Bacillus sp. N12A5]MCY8287715.1 alanine:cation symporter family protein [Bacillus sp. N13C7]MCY8639824.1 alanine:cation symporter family protein [Bacillus sp. S17B2]MCY8720937.1 alanine:cation symporter family protein [Bacillus sp. S10C12M]MCY9142854.1 alanine:cation symporter family protein [Bacillus sp. T9C1]
MESFFNSLINIPSDFIWKYLFYILIGLGLFFTIRFGFIQFRYFIEMFRIVGEKPEGNKGVSSMQAFFISAASRVGTGNLTGVALAIATGGPGAVFWMWVVAAVGMASSFVESTLAQLYKVKDGDDFRGGPAYYIQKGLGVRWLGIVFAVLITVSFGLIFNAVQTNTISGALDGAFHVNKIVVAIVLAALTAFIIFGGLKRVVAVSQLIVPVMAGIYILIALFVVITNITAFPGIIATIVKNAFGIEQIVGGGLGGIIVIGAQRGLFSNEAGMGSAPNAAATAHVSHPAKQGFIQTLGVFFDTFIVCTSTAFIILLYSVAPKGDGIQVTQAALNHHIGGWAPSFIAVAMFLFAFSSVVGNYYYGETNIEFIKTSKTWLNIYRIAVIAMVVYGSLSGFQIVWDMADLFMGIMALINLIVIALLSNVAYKVYKDYAKQRKQGLDPVFKAKNIPGLKNAETWEDEKQEA